MGATRRARREAKKISSARMKRTLTLAARRSLTLRMETRRQQVKRKKKRVLTTMTRL